MQPVDKHDNKVPSSASWRTKVLPIPSFLHDTKKDDLFSIVDEKDKGSLLMKGILYTILTATIGVLVGYVVSYLMRAPQASTTQALEELVSSVKTQSDTILAATKTASAQKTGKPDTPTDSKAAPKNPLSSLASLAAPPKTDASKNTPAGPVAQTLPPAANTPATAPATATPPAAPVAPALPPAAATVTTTANAPPAAAPETPPAAAAPAAKKPIPQGPVFLKGTNPYGPPPLVEEDIFDSSTLLRVEHDPSIPPSPPAYEPRTVETPTFQQLLQDPAPQKPAFQIQLGAFSSRLSATQFANRLQEKGYAVNIYEGSSKHSGTWYFVRLDKTLDHITALETAKNIHTTEKFLPMVVQPTDIEKKLR